MSFSPEMSVVDDHLGRILASAAFCRSERMCALLSYLVRAACDKQCEQIDQRAIAVDVLGRGEDFDPGSDAIVRAEIARLRSKLLEYYGGSGVDDELRIEFRRGSYRPVFVHADNKQEDSPACEEVPRHEIRYCRAADGVSIAYSVSGEGYPLFLLPTWMSHLETDHRNPMLSHYWIELAKRYCVIRFDCRGFGLSDREVPAYTLDTIAEDLHCVANVLGLKQFALFGPSGGAMIGTKYAAKYPERVSHLVFLGGFIRGPRASGVPAAIAHADAIDAAIRAGWGRSDSLFRQIFTSMLIPAGTAEQHALLDQAQLDAGSEDSAARFHRLLADTDLTDDVERVTAKALIFHGDREAVPISEGRYAASRIPNARLVPLPTANHILLADEPAWFMLLEELEQFISLRAAGTTTAIASS
jgi:pimeloyl-ACP methyl ester carboxylesterase